MTELRKSLKKIARRVRDGGQGSGRRPEGGSKEEYQPVNNSSSPSQSSIDNTLKSLGYGGLNKYTVGKMFEELQGGGYDPDTMEYSDPRAQKIAKLAEDIYTKRDYEEKELTSGEEEFLYMMENQHRYRPEPKIMYPLRD